MKNVSICTNTFSEDAGTPGTQKNGIVVSDGTNNTGYEPIEVCADNTFTGTDHSISGISQFNDLGTQPVVNITGVGAIAALYHVNQPVRNVDTGELFPTITQAVNDLDTVNGNTIAVPAGIYPENVVVSKSLIIKGPFAGTAGFDASRGGPGEAVIHPASGKSLQVKAADATVDGFAFDGATVNQHVVTTVAGSDNFHFVNNRITNVSGAAGITTSGGVADWEIKHNLFENFSNVFSGTWKYGQALKFNSTAGGVIEDNTFTTMRSRM